MKKAPFVREKLPRECRRPSDERIGDAYKALKLALTILTPPEMPPPEFRLRPSRILRCPTPKVVDIMSERGSKDWIIVNLRFHPDDWARIDKLATTYKCHRQSVIRRAVKDWLDAQPDVES